MKAAMLAMRFLLELAALAGLAVWGVHVGTPAWDKVALAMAAPVAMAVVWGLWVAPRAVRRLPDPARLVVELAILAVVSAAIALSGYPVVAAVFAALAIANGAVLRLAYPETPAG